MPKSEIVKKAKKKKLIRELISFAKFLIFIVVVGGILVLYKSDNVDFSKIKNNSLSFITDTLNSFRDVKENQHPISNEKIAKTANKKVVCVDPTQIKQGNQYPISNEESKPAENLGDKTANTANSSKEIAKVAETSLNNSNKNKIPRKVKYVSDDDIVSDEIAVTVERPFQYGLANKIEVDDYSWNIDIEPHTISEDLRIYNTRNKGMNGEKIIPWMYMTDDLSYNTQKLIDINPDFKIQNTQKLSGEWNEKFKITSN